MKSRTEFKSGLQTNKKLIARKRKLTALLLCVITVLSSFAPVIGLDAENFNEGDNYDYAIHTNAGSGETGYAQNLGANEYERDFDESNLDSDIEINWNELYIFYDDTYTTLDDLYIIRDEFDESNPLWHEWQLQLELDEMELPYTIRSWQPGDTHYMGSGVDEFGVLISPAPLNAGPVVFFPHQNQQVSLLVGFNASWNTFPGATGYTVTMRNLTTNQLVLPQQVLGQNARSFWVEQHRLTGGHQFRIAISARVGSQEFWTNIYFWAATAAPTITTPNHEYQVIPHQGIGFTWHPAPHATSYLVSLLNLNTGVHVWNRVSNHTTIRVALPNQLTPGHSYRLAVGSVTNGREGHWSYRHFSVQAPIPTLSLNPNIATINAPATGHWNSIAVNTNQANWNAWSSNTSWLTVTGSGAPGGNMNINAAQNPHPFTRHATITISAGNAPQRTIIVNQAAAVIPIIPTVTLNPISNITQGQSVTISGQATIPNATTFRISAVVHGPGLPVNGHWLGEVEHSNTYSSRQFTPPLAGTYTVTLYARSFPEHDPRTGQNRAMQSFVVTAPAPTLTINPNINTWTPSAAANTNHITITTNQANWNAWSSNTSWLTVSGSGVPGTALTINALANTGTGSRSATITITAGNAPARTINVMQAGLQPNPTITYPRSNNQIFSREDGVTITWNPVPGATHTVSWWGLIPDTNIADVDGEILTDFDADTNNTINHILNNMMLNDGIIDISSFDPQFSGIPAPDGRITIPPSQLVAGQQYIFVVDAELNGYSTQSSVIFIVRIDDALITHPRADGDRVSRQDLVVFWNPHPFAIYNVTVYRMVNGVATQRVVNNEQTRIPAFWIQQNVLTEGGTYRLDVTVTVGSQVTSGSRVFRAGEALDPFFEFYGELGWLFPLPYSRHISSGFRDVRHDIHQGIDIVRVPGDYLDHRNRIRGEAVFAAHDGLVVRSGDGGGSGHRVTLRSTVVGTGEYGEYIVSRYMHLLDPAASYNSNLLPYIELPSLSSFLLMGTQIGGVGNTGTSSNYHLHLDFNNRSLEGIVGEGNAMNPERFFPDITFTGLSNRTP